MKKIRKLIDQIGYMFTRDNSCWQLFIMCPYWDTHCSDYRKAEKNY